MPNRDATGPMGMGSRTGRGMGPCGAGRGRGFGMGMDRGRGFWTINKDDRKKILKEEAEYLREDLKEIEKELEDSSK